jgi:hypothetical protein
MRLDYKADIVFRNVCFIRSGIANSVAVKDNKIFLIGTDSETRSVTGYDTKSVDCQGMVMIPGFHDAHIHFLRLSANLTKLYCGPEKAPTITRIKELLESEARKIPHGDWVKGWGYDHELLLEKRHPNRLDLDQAVPNHPVRLDNVSGHATVMNTMAMSKLGFSEYTVDPPNGVIDREKESGLPSGLFLDMGEYIGKSLIPYRDQPELEEGIIHANQLLISKGITSIQDAGIGNDLERWSLFKRLKTLELLDPQVTMMVGYEHCKEFREAKVAMNRASMGLYVGPAKIMLSLTTGNLVPSQKNLTDTIINLQSEGWQVAVHAVEQESIECAATAICSASKIKLGARHRIEHCSEGDPKVLSLVNESGALVVTNPGFVHHFGDRYLKMLDSDMVSNIYPSGGLENLDIPWAIGSDAPMITPDPILDIYTCVTRLSKNGSPVGKEQTISGLQGLKAYTYGAAYSCFREREVGSLERGKFADLVLLNRDPTRLGDYLPADVNVKMTIIRGEVVYAN